MLYLIKLAHQLPKIKTTIIFYMLLIFMLLTNCMYIDFKKEVTV